MRKGPMRITGERLVANDESSINAVIRHLHGRTGQRLEDLIAFLKVPSISADPGGASSMAECARLVAGLLKASGLGDVRVQETGGHPLVTASWCKRPDRPTILIYGHYDVQPVDPLQEWRRPPFDPYVEDERIIARGAADDKGQILMHIKAVEAILRTAQTLPVNVKFLIEGEEEIGSPNLPAFLTANQDLLAADVAIISDSSMWDLGQPSITTSLRGLTLFQVTVSGPDRDLHSGSYGGAVMNPLEALARLLASVKDDQGRVLIPGFYDRVRPLSQEMHPGHLPFDERAYLASIGLTEGWGDVRYSTLERIWHRPTFEINGMWGGFTGDGAKTVIPAQAHAKISLRLVADQDPQEMVDLCSHFLQERAPPGVKITITPFDGGGRPFTTPPDLPALQAARRALHETFAHQPVATGEGGSIPVAAQFKEIMGLETLLVGFVPPGSRTHSPNENFHLPTFHQGIESLVRFLHYL